MQCISWMISNHQPRSNSSNHIHHQLDQLDQCASVFSCGHINTCTQTHIHTCARTSLLDLYIMASYIIFGPVYCTRQCGSFNAHIADHGKRVVHAFPALEGSSLGCVERGASSYLSLTHSLYACTDIMGPNTTPPTRA